jgi:hypothetical protein
MGRITNSLHHHRDANSPLTRKRQKMIANIGEKCPQGGTWHPVGNPSDTRSIGIGNIMPPTPNGEPHWVLKTPTGDK